MPNHKFIGLTLLCLLFIVGCGRAGDPISPSAVEYQYPNPNIEAE
ncbi:MAG: hypothetical protein AAF403_03075 [Pseudomonadota bacterium]